MTERYNSTTATDAAAQALAAVADRYAVSITPTMQDLVDGGVPDGPIAKQFVPHPAELVGMPDELDDPIGDDRHSPVPCVVHRYPDRALLLPLKVCAVYCRYCFRREALGGDDAALLSDDALQRAYDYIASQPGIWEVVLSGGDPLVLSPRRLGSILSSLGAIPHVRVLRIHSRVPLVAPEKITKELVWTLRCAAPLFVVVHTNHPDEFTPGGDAALARLVDGGTPLLSQSVLLKGVNDDPQTLERLLRRCVENRVKPYYLHHLDRAPGTARFRVPIARGRELTEALRGRVSGLCRAEYVIDIPGGHGKAPLAAAFAANTDDGGWRIRDHRGGTHMIRDDEEEAAP